MTELKGQCPHCGSSELHWKDVKSYHYRQSGLENVWLHGGVRKARCIACDMELVHIEDEWQLLQVIALALLQKPTLLTGSETRFLREAADLTQTELASLLQLGRQATISERERKTGAVMTFPEDLGFRLIILKAFATFLASNPDEDFLAQEHRRIMKGLVGVLCQARTLIKARDRKTRVELQRSKAAWRAEPPLAA